MVAVRFQFTGVLGAFNCQGGGWSREDRRNKSASHCSRTLTATATAMDIEWHNGSRPFPLGGAQLFAVYLSRARKVELRKPEEKIEITLDPFDYELLTVSPVKTLPLSSSEAVQFAPIGLVNMLNSGGAVQSLEMGRSKVAIEVKGAGEMRAFSSAPPVGCRINGEETEFTYEEGMVALHVPWSASSSKLTLVEYSF